MRLILPPYQIFYFGEPGAEGSEPEHVIHGFPHSLPVSAAGELRSAHIPFATNVDDDVDDDDEREHPLTLGCSRNPSLSHTWTVLYST